MKKSFLALFFSLVAFTWASAQSPRVTAEGKNVSVAYGQPSKKGRVLFGKEGSESLEKYDKIWRTGANASTEITFKKDGKFGGKDVKAGTYSLFTIPGEKQWTVILNSVLGQSGAYEYEKNKEKDVLKVSVPAKKYPTSAEKLTFTVTDKSVDFQWDKEGFSVPVKF
ncbi:DUF2911 domain-containing protein [Dyadobacter sp. Leaf189]|uniref:DUF2911 domain-containing protein n=1 Tax=Dyadobacter sp. Leaf189 TaxID=1736295 RepID=UPI0006F75B1D|nr:DUF2911 domain-containing protein [Dyadobacter sp. Leaf189]KQS33543.1 hypothetical protein ASG33_05600 [Dyadobacter sp. Leaf189]